MIDIAFLADHPETIPTLADWFRAQWPDYYAGRTSAEVAQDFYAEAQHNRLPVRLVAFADGAPAGTICLRQRATDDLPDYRPGLGGLYVIAQQRGRGIGTALVAAGMDVARVQGYATVYAMTVAAQGILERLGWTLVRTHSHNGEQHMLYGCDLAEHSGYWYKTPISADS